MFACVLLRRGTIHQTPLLVIIFGEKDFPWLSHGPCFNWKTCLRSHRRDCRKMTIQHVDSSGNADMFLYTKQHMVRTPAFSLLCKSILRHSRLSQAGSTVWFNTEPNVAVFPVDPISATTHWSRYLNVRQFFIVLAPAMVNGVNQFDCDLDREV
jgi:hypothetical protein